MPLNTFTFLVDQDNIALCASKFKELDSISLATITADTPQLQPTRHRFATTSFQHQEHE